MIQFAAIRISCGRVITLMALVCLPALDRLDGQEGEKSSPSPVTSPGKGAVAPASSQTPVDATALLISLAMKANGGDEAAARSLASRLLSGETASVDQDFEKAVKEASSIEASRILGLTLLRSTNESLHPEGLTFIKKAVEAESAPAMEVMARILLEGQFGQKKSVEEAVSLLRRARQLPGAKDAHRMLGDLSLAGEGVPQDAAIAMEHYRRGAETGSVACLVALHRLFRDGRAFPVDLNESERYGILAAESGNAEAAFELAVFYEKHADGAPSWEKASRWLRVAAERGYPGATRLLGDYFLTDRLGDPNPAEAIRLFRVAAGQRDGEACLKIAEAYETGKNLPQDPVASTAWIRVGADFAYAPAENALGLRLITGYGTASNPAEAVQWFLRSAKQGFALAMVNLGELHEKGVGLPVNPAEARRYYEEAAKAGNAGAQERLARLLSGGTDPALKDLPTAAFWAARAAGAGLESAVPLAESLRNGLDPAQREKLEQRLAEKGAIED
jgi:TPR repeat protein